MSKAKILQMAVLASAVALTACGSRGGEETTEVAVEPVATPAPVVAPVVTPAEPATDWAQEERNFLVENSVVYFDFDRSTVRDDARRTLGAHVAYLLATDSAQVMLEGHTDERGTREYNMALGERRAKAVESYLKLRGVRAGQVQTTSFGKERLASSDHGLNRRVEIKYLAW